MKRQKTDNPSDQQFLDNLKILMGIFGHKSSGDIIENAAKVSKDNRLKPPVGFYYSDIAPQLKGEKSFTCTVKGRLHHFYNFMVNTADEKTKEKAHDSLAILKSLKDVKSNAKSFTNGKFFAKKSYVTPSDTHQTAKTAINLTDTSNEKTHPCGNFLATNSFVTRNAISLSSVATANNSEETHQSDKFTESHVTRNAIDPSSVATEKGYASDDSTDTEEQNDFGIKNS